MLTILLTLVLTGQTWGDGEAVVEGWTGTGELAAKPPPTEVYQELESFRSKLHNRLSRAVQALEDSDYAPEYYEDTGIIPEPVTTYTPAHDIPFTGTDSRMRYPVTSIWAPGQNRWTARFDQQAEVDRAESEFLDWLKAESLRNPQLMYPMAVVGDGMTFVFNHIQRIFFMMRMIECPDCYELTALDVTKHAGYIAKIQSMQCEGLYPWCDETRKIPLLPKDAIYDTVLVKTDMRRSLTLTYDALKADGRYDRSMWMRPDMLEHVRMVGPDILYVKPMDAMDIPEWVRKYYALHIGHAVSDQWLMASATRLGGLSWYEYRRTKGHLPGSRDLVDMQINYVLREGSNRDPLARIDRCEPEHGFRGFGVNGRFTDCAEILYFEERANMLTDTRSANELADDWLGVDPDRPPIAEVIEQDRQAQLIFELPDMSKAEQGRLYDYVGLIKETPEEPPEPGELNRAIYGSREDE